MFRPQGELLASANNPMRLVRVRKIQTDPLPLAERALPFAERPFCRAKRRRVQPQELRWAEKQPLDYGKIKCSMRLKQGCVLVLLASCWVSCSGRIQKLPISSEDRVAAHRLTLDGDRLIREGKDHLALLKYVEATTFDPYNESIFNKLAIAYCRLLQFNRAKSAVTRALRLNPDYASGHNTRGIVVLALQDPSEAVKEFKRAVKLDPRKAAFHVNLGRAYVQTGKFEQGRKAFQAALAIDPDIFEFEGLIQVTTVEPDRPDPENAYQLAKLFAEIGDRETSLYYLRKAFSDGFRDRERLKSEAAFEKMRDDAEFVSLTQDYGMQS